MEYHFIIKHPFFVFFKKHHCPICGKVLRREKTKRTVTSGTLEGDKVCEDKGVFPEFSNFRGDTTVIWYVFECPNCAFSCSVDYLYNRNL